MSILETICIHFLSHLRLIIHKFKIHTRWKQQIQQLRTQLIKLIKLTNTNSFILLHLLVIVIFLTKFVIAGPAKLILYQGLKKLEISSKQCRAGIYMKNSTTFTCACVTGVWGFYHDYCSKPISIIGGDSYCFRMKNHSISQVVGFGSLKYPFEASLSIFQKGFFTMTGSHTDDNSTLSEPTSSFLTITDTSWTIYSETGDALCLKATTIGKRKFCLFGDEGNRRLRKWNSITKIKKGCLSKDIRRADSCSDILPPNDYADCSLDLLDDLVTEPSNDISIATEDSPGWIPIKRVNVSGDTEESPGWIPIKKIEVPDESESPGWIPIKQINVSDDDEESAGWIPVKRIEVPDESPGWIPIKRIPVTDDYEESPSWIPIKRVNVTEDTEESPGWIPIKRINENDDPDEPPGWIPVKRIDLSDDEDESSRSTEESPGWIPINRIEVPDESSDEDSQEWIPIKRIPSKDQTTAVATTDSSEELIPPGWIRIPSKKSPMTPAVEKSSSSEEWIPIYHFTTTTTEEPETSIATTEFDNYEVTSVKPEDICASDMTREKVKEYWLDPANNECSKSINEAVFTDQLRRFTVKQFDTIFQSRLKSLAQMEQMLNYTKLIMQKTCGEDYVPGEFFQVAFSAFMMFIKEDFFYGVEGATPDVYPRILKTLKKCLNKAEPFVFETDSLDCGMKKINGWLIRPGKRDRLEVPIKSISNSFEPLIETTWKMFLNTHSLCFSDFQFSNDHHHFSVLIMELFSKSIYEKWIEPLDSQELYSFILPNFNFLKETMENIDYCVAATNQISTCPAWMSRSGVSSSARRKRSIWVDKAAEDKKRSEVWDGEAFCLQKMEDPETRLGLKECAPS